MPLSESENVAVGTAGTQPAPHEAELQAGQQAPGIPAGRPRRGRHFSHAQAADPSNPPNREPAAHEAELQEVQFAADVQKLPPISLGALFMPPVWGAAHGQWLTLLFYPLWLFADNCFVSAVQQGGIFIALSAIVLLGTLAVTVFFARTWRIPAYRRVAATVPIERYLKREKVWAAVCAANALIFVAFATWYNLAERLPSA
jgi:hypothetical protein